MTLKAEFLDEAISSHLKISLILVLHSLEKSRVIGHESNSLCVHQHPPPKNYLGFFRFMMLVNSLLWFDSWPKSNYN